MRPLLALLLAALCALAPAQDLAAPPPGRVVCPTCAGEGVAEQACLDCYGGEVPCPTCNTFYDRYDDLVFRRSEHVEADKWAPLRGGMQAIRVAADVLGAGTPGKVACPMGCVSLPYGTTRGPCKLCAGEKLVPCVACGDTEGMRRCAFCAGTGVVKRACDDCLGAGTLPDPLADVAAGTKDCRWCDAKGVRPCDECDAHGQVRLACETCYGTGKHMCTTCRGAGDAPCEVCYATGQVQKSGGSKKLVTCKACRKRGFVKCKACKEGVAACADCAETGTRERACLACEGNKVRPCAGCFRGLYRQCEVNARLCADAGEPQRALAWCDEALWRVELRRSNTLRWCRGNDADRARQTQAIDARRDAELVRLRELRATLEAARKDAGR